MHDPPIRLSVKFDRLQLGRELIARSRRALRIFRFAHRGRLLEQLREGARISGFTDERLLTARFGQTAVA